MTKHRNIGAIYASRIPTIQVHSNPRTWFQCQSLNIILAVFASSCALLSLKTKRTHRILCRQECVLDYYFPFVNSWVEAKYYARLTRQKELVDPPRVIKKSLVKFPFVVWWTVIRKTLTVAIRTNRIFIIVKPTTPRRHLSGESADYSQKLTWDPYEVCNSWDISTQLVSLSCNLSLSDKHWPSLTIRRRVPENIRPASVRSTRNTLAKIRNNIAVV